MTASGQAMTQCEIATARLFETYTINRSALHVHSLILGDGARRT
jgi:hypothetical protein